MNDAYQEHLNSQPDSLGEIDQESARDRGSRYPNRQWILSDRDVWYVNHYYVGPPQRHPEDQWD